MDNSYADAYPDLYRRHWWWRAREAILLERLNRLFNHHHGSARILDVGCGAGLFFDALQVFGHVEGVESDPVAVRMAGKWRHRICEGELDMSFEPGEPYDAILLLDVLEHVPDPSGALQAAKRVLKPTGFVLITVPAFQWLWTSHDDLNHHMRRYTKSEMQQAVQSAGLVVTEASYLFPSLVIPKAIVRMRELTKASGVRVPRIPSPAANTALTLWCRAEHRFARWVPFGTSLIVVARLTD